MAHSPHTVADLRALYVAGKPLETAAKEFGVANGTARRWRQDALRRGDDWKAAREGIALPPAGAPAALAAIERLEARLCDGLTGEVSEIITASAREFDIIGGLVERYGSALKRELRLGFAAVMILGALVAVWTLFAG